MCAVTASSLVHTVDTARARRFAVRGAVSAPIKKVHLGELGIDRQSFLMRLAPTFYNLSFDAYDPALAAEEYVRTAFRDVYSANEKSWLMLWNELSERHFGDALAGPAYWSSLVSSEAQSVLLAIRPYRRRSCFQYHAKPDSTPFRWHLREVGTPTFTQAVTDARARPRRFESAHPAVYRDPDVLLLIAMVCELIRQMPSVVASSFKVTLHQMLTYATAATGSKPAPEGTHQDGSPFILSALVIERQNITGGVSSVYYTKREALAFRSELQPGEGILQSDRHHALWHGVSPIFAVDATKTAFRSIIGLDIDFLDIDARFK